MIRCISSISGDIVGLIEDYHAIAISMSATDDKPKKFSYSLFEFVYSKFINDDDMSSTDDGICASPPASFNPGQSNFETQSDTTVATELIRESHSVEFVESCDVDNKRVELFDESDDDTWLEKFYGVP